MSKKQLVKWQQSKTIDDNRKILVLLLTEVFSKFNFVASNSSIISLADLAVGWISLDSIEQTFFFSSKSSNHEIFLSINSIFENCLETCYFPNQIIERRKMFSSKRKTSTWIKKKQKHLPAKFYLTVSNYVKRYF